ncbi:beta-glucuronidase [Pseudomaricurvus alcaniphilus]|uniref:glycoside hydrolase family 2 protein n=1 Tax=Pseudomaricurvus alcaniphilus TaxID=1166482 RepID=UPI00140B7A9F|nr:glycoside hydrolase family 2 TIM barrel-domain containing protein [Pseudomaricurvus alcaniphilus]NHN35785.1 beta-glucuronidase [Pseudomaricurvus alcaniphilus]
MKPALTQSIIVILCWLIGSVCTAVQAAQTEEDRGLFETLLAKGAELPAPAPLLTNITSRTTQSLNGKWNVVVDEHEWGDKAIFAGTYYDPTPLDGTGMQLKEFAFNEGRQLNVPGDWNTQDDTLFRYRGVVWYQRTFDVKKDDHKRYFLHFDGVNYFANVYLNGKPLGSHKGGYTAFNIEATEALQDGSNYLVVRVDGKLDESTVPTVKTSDFFKYSGITRDVNLVTVPKTFVRQYHLYLADLASGRVKGWVQLDGPDAGNSKVELKIKEAGVDTSIQTAADGRGEFEFKADLSLWSPETPKLYDVTLTSKGHSVSDRIGFRTVATRGKQILLNGKPVYFRGISLHDESFLKSGVAYDRADAQAQLGLIKELNGNYVRLAHYPHNEHTVRMADELGLMVWSEIPIVSVIDWHNPETLAVAKTQVVDNVSRDLNRASVVMWSVANETQPQSAARLAFLTTLAETARSLDDSRRPIAAALIGDAAKEFAEVTKRLVAEMLRDPEITDPSTRARLQAMADELFAGELDKVLNSEIEVMLDDQLGSVVDIVGYNEYFGWYYSAFLERSLPVDQATIRRTMFGIMKDIRFRNVFGKPMIISEFGAGAKKGYVSPQGPGKLWTEEYQAKVYTYQLDMLDRNDFVQGMSPWILKDFRSAARELNYIQGIYNRKGLVSEEGEKKKAFSVLQSFYQQKAAGN